MHLRAMSAADAASAAALTARAPEASAWSAADYSHLLQPDGGGFGFVAELPASSPSNAQPAGFLAGRVVVDEAEILNVAVDPSVRRRGAGRALVEAALRHARTRGARRVFLEVRAGNLVAQGLYQACGFSQIARRAGYYQAPAEDAIVMQRLAD